MSFDVRRYADFGTGEPWVARITLGLPDLINALPTTPELREAFQTALGHLHEALGMAFNDLREVRRLAADAEAPELDRAQAYAGLYGHLLQAYKDRFQALTLTIGCDIGFQFQTQRNFETGATRLLEEHPEVDPDLIEMIRQDRTDWQGALARYRNDHWEHRKTIDPKLVAVFHRPDSAATIFENVWQAIEDIVVLFLLRPLAPPGIALVDVPEGDRDPAMPKRFKFVPTVLLSNLPQISEEVADQTTD